MMKREISRCEVACHCVPEDVWMIIGNEVFDLTPFLEEHPGGMEILLEFAGGDATDAFESVGHSMAARVRLDKFKVGDLPEEEQLIYGSSYIAQAKVSLPINSN
ncbi:hypothetical protein WR25_08829 [Diploscapter pachys]|uniref:Cytochrome b5 n=1 Tax=Diploscapter pachys TaxID=2018661 RepID=A0A2A2JB22_9BILA|nr:hypothetical protein WR25_08829 [Diploscapter pachys]